MRTLIPSLWLVTYYDEKNKKLSSVIVHALTRRFALWNATEYLGFPRGKATASKYKAKSVDENND